MEKGKISLPLRPAAGSSKDDAKKGGSGVKDEADVTTRRITNDYSRYNPISAKAGEEDIRLLHILPSDNDENEEEELFCTLSDMPLSAGCVYIALSYCWGDMSDQHAINLLHHQRRNGSFGVGDGLELLIGDASMKQKFNVTSTLYRALKSIREASPWFKELDPIFRYQPLWVDALCINQNDILERNSQVGMMKSIYSKARMVLIWLGESEDIDFGLRVIIAMVEALREKYGDQFDIAAIDDNQMEFLFLMGFPYGDRFLNWQDFREALDRLFSNPYFNRIWVLQEATCNAEATFIHTSTAHLPWPWILVAMRFQSLCQRRYIAWSCSNLPPIWEPLIRARIKHVEDAHGGRRVPNPENCGIYGSLYELFINTHVFFKASDVRDKLFALISFAGETQPGMPSRTELAPDYRKSASEVFSTFSIWCLRSEHNLDPLSYVSCGLRRVAPGHRWKYESKDGVLPKSCIDATRHPSWALWPTPAPDHWRQAVLVLGEDFTFSLAEDLPMRLYNLETHPTIKLPPTLRHRFLSVEGQRLGIVKSKCSRLLNCIETDHTHQIAKQVWATYLPPAGSNVAVEMEKNPRWPQLVMSHPFREKSGIKSIAYLWATILRDKVLEAEHDGETPGAPPKQWLGREGGRYQDKEELLFRDFIETIMLDPVYRSSKLLEGHGTTQDERGVPDGPWRDETVATSLAMYWLEIDPSFDLVPTRVSKFLKVELHERPIQQTQYFPHLCPSIGRCFFITEGERMGMCPPDTEPGDIIVMLHGAKVPFVVRPVVNEGYSEDTDWTFPGSDMLRDTSYRFIGDCYLHERMTKSFVDEHGDELGESEIFNLV